MNDEEFFIALGKQIKQLRKKKNLSLREFAFRCEMEKPNIARIESGRTRPTTVTLRIIAAQLDIKVRDLFDFE